MSDETERVEIIQDQGPHWDPVVGPETMALLDRVRVPQGSRDVVRDEAIEVLRRCVSPHVPEGSDTGIVVGYVQSGKTMSFTAVAALARDNGYGLVIVITGTKRNLYEQSKERLLSDLEVDACSSGWTHFGNPSPSDSAAIRRIRSAIGSFRDEDALPVLRRTVLLTVMKNHVRLRDLTQLLAALDLDAIPTLVIDDEADQAGLNTLVSQAEESPTYSRLLSLREALPHHTYLQYTATPQAPLLISVIDSLSPSFVCVLTPGEDYTGGLRFFEGPSGLVRTIPASDLSTSVDTVEPPPSLLQAMRVFIVGMTSNLLAPPYQSRSMLVHPSHLQDVHSQYAQWVRAVLRRWEDQLALPGDHPDLQDVLDEFEAAYQDLRRTVEDMPAWGDIARYLRSAVGATAVSIINSSPGGTSELDWGPSQILVGGMSIERGVTVAGLTVTYMPRDPGVRNADSIQQRARWFGYKSDYLGYCRVYLSDEMQHVYREYVTHEEHMRETLREAQRLRMPLQEWRRAFFLDPSLQPTRRNVIGLDYMRGNFRSGWFWPRTAHWSEAALEANRQTTEMFVAAHQFSDAPWSDSATAHQIHQLARRVPLRQVYEDLLVPFRISGPDDSLRFQGLLLQVDAYLESHSEETASVYHMRPSVEMNRTAESGQINELFQGRSPAGADRYPGDTHFRAEEGLTVQIHHVNINDAEGRRISTNVPIIAVWLTPEMAKPYLIQRD